MILAPLSEFYGRRPIYLVSFSFFTLLLLPCALAPNIAVLLVFRFFSGMAGSAFLSVAGGTIGDMFSGRSLGAPMMIFTACPVCSSSDFPDGCVMADILSSSAPKSAPSSEASWTRTPTGDGHSGR